MNFSQSLSRTRRSRLAFLEMDLAVGLTILALAIIPLGFSFARERDALRADYFRAVAVEVVDGEAEILAAGDCKNYPDGSQVYTVHSLAAAKLPPGHFELTKAGNHIRLEWTSDKRRGIGAVVREFNVK